MNQLIAISPILFESTNFKPGDELPTYNSGLVKIWVENGTAVWKDTEPQKKQGVKVKQVTASAGLVGDAYPSAGQEQDLVGKPPSRKARGIVPEPAKGRRKSRA